MKFKLPDKIVIDGVSVRPYVTLDEQKIITDEMDNFNTVFEREAMMVACIVSACTDLFDEDESIEYSYEDIVYSGFWGKILHKCPAINDAVKNIRAEIKDRHSAERVGKIIIDEINSGLIDKLAEEVKNLGSEE